MFDWEHSGDNDTYRKGSCLGRAVVTPLFTTTVILLAAYTRTLFQGWLF